MKTDISAPANLSVVLWFLVGGEILELEWS
jgi:hypothetical protein